MEEQKKVKGWFTEEMKNKPRDDREEDTEDMFEWRSMSQEEMDQCWKELAEKMEEEVDKYKVDDSKRGAHRGRGSLLEWRRVRKSRKYRAREMRWLPLQSPSGLDKRNKRRRGVVLQDALGDATKVYPLSKNERICGSEMAMKVMKKPREEVEEKASNCRSQRTERKERVR